MRVLQVGDIARVSYHLTKFLQQNGVDARLLVNKFYQYPVQPWIDQNPNIPVLKRALSFAKLISRYRGVDVYHGHGLASLLLFAAGKDYVAHLHGDDLLEVAPSPTLMGKLLRQALRNACAILVSTPNLLSYVERLGLNKSSPLFFLPNPVDVDVFRPASTTTALRERREFTIFHPAAFAGKKHNAELLHAVAHLSTKYDVLLYMTERIAKQEDRDLRDNLIRELGLTNIRWVRSLELDQMVQFYNTVDIVADQFNPEPCICLIALEAMASQKPVIAGGSGYERFYAKGPPLFTGSNREEIAASLEFLFQHRTRWKEFGEEGRDWVTTHHGPSEVVSKLMDIYREVF